VLRLLEDSARKPLTQGLERLTPDDSRKTLTLAGSPEAIKTVEQVTRWLDVPTPQVEVLIDLEEQPGSPLQGRAILRQNERGSVVLVGKDSRLTLQLMPHLNRDGTCTMAMGATYLRNVPGENRASTTGITSFQRGKLGRPLTLGLAALRNGDETVAPTLSVRITPRIKR
jgi:hypothetical protein